MAVRSGDDRQVCLRLLQRLASARRAIIGIYFPPIPWPMTITSCECSARSARAKPKLRARSTSRERTARAARGEAQAHLLSRPGCTRLPLPLGYTRLPRPVRVRSWGGWVRNGIKVYNLYHQLPRPLGYTRLPRPLGFTRLPRPVRVRSWGGRGQSPSCECVAQAASAQREPRVTKPEHTSCPDQAAPGCPDH